MSGAKAGYSQHILVSSCVSFSFHCLLGFRNIFTWLSLCHNCMKLSCTFPIIKIILGHWRDVISWIAQLWETDLGKDQEFCTAENSTVLFVIPSVRRVDTVHYSLPLGRMLVQVFAISDNLMESILSNSTEWNIPVWCLVEEMDGFNSFFPLVISSDFFPRQLDQHNSSCYQINTYGQIPAGQLPLKRELDKISVTLGQCLAPCVIQRYAFWLNLECWEMS